MELLVFEKLSGIVFVSGDGKPDIVVGNEGVSAIISATADVVPPFLGTDDEVDVWSNMLGDGGSEEILEELLAG